MDLGAIGSPRRSCVEPGRGRRTRACLCASSSRFTATSMPPPGLKTAEIRAFPDVAADNGERTSTASRGRKARVACHHRFGSCSAHPYPRARSGVPQAAGLARVTGKGQCHLLPLEDVLLSPDGSSGQYRDGLRKVGAVLCSAVPSASPRPGSPRPRRGTQVPPLPQRHPNGISSIPEAPVTCPRP